NIPEGKLTTDPLGNIYIYNKGDLTKYTPEGVEIARYSSREFGDITSVDASNSLKILVVFADFSKAVILDASLGQNTSLDLTANGLQLVKLICSSRETGYWVYDPVDKRLKRINDHLDIAVEGTPLRQITDESLTPQYLFDSGNWLIMNVPGYGFLIFDRFGTYYKTIKPGINTMFQANGHEILYKEMDHMVQINIQTGVTRNFLLPVNNPEDECRVEGKRIFLLKKNALKIYSY
ncbi:MAG TPA: hypothetical protein PKD91_07665, partial [Bacteroidia bacterium]|nr:hypothetical protein [Bacteroidia bacterium]